MVRQVVICRENSSKSPACHGVSAWISLPKLQMNAHEGMSQDGEMLGDSARLSRFHPARQKLKPIHPTLPLNSALIGVYLRLKCGQFVVDLTRLNLNICNPGYPGKRNCR